jgi:hypothetical protein
MQTVCKGSKVPWSGFVLTGGRVVEASTHGGGLVALTQELLVLLLFGATMPVAVQDKK